MPTLTVDNFTFAFQGSLAAEKYDLWEHYINAWNAAGGQKALDVVAVETRTNPMVTWLIEARDFRIITNPPRPSKISGLAQIVAAKVTHTVNGLVSARAGATQIIEKNHAALALSAKARRVVLHLEPHVGAHSALFPVGFPASVLQKLRQLVRTTDRNPLVLNIANTPAAGVPWTVN